MELPGFRNFYHQQKFYFRVSHSQFMSVKFTMRSAFHNIAISYAIGVRIVIITLHYCRLSSIILHRFINARLSVRLLCYIYSLSVGADSDTLHVQLLRWHSSTRRAVLDTGRYAYVPRPHLYTQSWKCGSPPTRPCGAIRIKRPSVEDSQLHCVTGSL